jgi:hypothetical protein
MHRIRRNKKLLLYSLTSGWMALSGYLKLHDARGEAGVINVELLLERRYEALFFASALILFLSALATLRWPRLATALAVCVPIISLPYFLNTLYYSFLAALLFIFVFPEAYLGLWIPWALVWITGIVSLASLLRQ